MEFLKMLLTIISFPLKCFLSRYETLKKDGKILEIIVFFLLAATGSLIIAKTLYSLGYWIYTEHTEILYCLAGIILLILFVKSQSKNSEPQPEVVPKDQQNLKEKADKIYPMIRNIMYQTFKEIAESIGGVIPRVLQQIEVREVHYIISNDIIFYQFKLDKEDVNIRYDKNELKEFANILQTAITRKIQAGDFPAIATAISIDANGNTYDTICIDVIEDVDSFFLIQVVLYTPEYSGYLKYKEMNQETSATSNNVPDAKWDK